MDLNKEAEETPLIFNEKKLRLEISRIFGEYGAHMIVFDMLIEKAETNSKYVQSKVLQAQIDALKELAEADGSTTVSSRIILTDLKEQLKKLENE
jgi:hypothetical protein